MVPVAKRGTYVAGLVFTILPFCPSTLWAQLISEAANWRWNAALVCGWNFIGLVLVLAFYRDPPRPADRQTKREILRKIDYIGGLLSIGGCIMFMMGMQWGAVQVRLLFLCPGPPRLPLTVWISISGTVSTSSSRSFWVFFSSSPSSFMK